MRIKILLASAAALALGLASSNAQVYSANIVGYVTVPLTTGYTMVANQMDVDGTQTNNTLATVLSTNLPSGMILEAWNPATVNFTSTKWTGTKWTANNQLITNALQIGNGFFIQTSVPTNIIEVGDVIQGTNNYPVTAGFQVVSANAPLSGGIRTGLGYAPSVGDVVEVWNNPTTSFVSHKWTGSSWTGGGEPILAPSEAVFLNAKSNNVWTQTFTAP